jgi:hypothetical protein
MRTCLHREDRNNAEECSGGYSGITMKPGTTKGLILVGRRYGYYYVVDLLKCQEDKAYEQVRHHIKLQFKLQ